jgi:predicted Rossmann fold nucleotide-binding protein DprA/Smf involved in DNA uptake
LEIRSAHRLLEHVGSAQAASMDSILSGVALPPPRIMQTLLELEMNGLIRQLPGKNFIRKL